MLYHTFSHCQGLSDLHHEHAFTEVLYQQQEVFETDRSIRVEITISPHRVRLTKVTGEEQKVRERYFSVEIHVAYQTTAFVCSVEGEQIVRFSVTV